MPLSDNYIYLDNNATTAVDASVVEEMLPFLTQHYLTPSSPYTGGKQVAEAAGVARKRVADLFQANPEEILFTSCGTEATNAAIHSALAADPDRQHIVTTRVEHSATLKTCELLAKKGVEVTWLGVDKKGQIDLEELEKAIRPDTALVTAMWANNETGTVFPIDTIAGITKNKGVYFHTDAVQAVGKLPLSFHGTGIQFASLSGHKLYSPKGIGALYVNRKTRFTPFVTGGGQENGKRGGTQNVASIVAFGKACELAGINLGEKQQQLSQLRNTFEAEVIRSIPAVEINGDIQNRLPNTTSLSFDRVDGETLLLLLDEKNVLCSAGSACTSGSVHPSHVLKAMGCSDKHARSSLRFSFSKNNKPEEIQVVVEILKQAVEKLRTV